MRLPNIKGMEEGAMTQDYLQTILIIIHVNS